MPQTVQEIMTLDPATLPSTASVAEAAQCMKERNIGDVLIMDNGRLAGVVTDRDIVVRTIADGRDPASTKLRDICSGDLVGLTPSDTVEDAVRMMREQAIRRLPVVDNGRPVGIVSIGDLATERDPSSALADISTAPPNR